MKLLFYFSCGYTTQVLAKSLLHVQTHPLNSKAQNLSQEETKGELLVTVGHIDQKSDLFRPKIFCFCHIV